jgi:hypothetical protein
MQVSKRALSAKERGRKGGLATARNHSQEFLEQRSAKAGEATRDRYGIGFYRYLRSLRPNKIKTPREKLIRTIVPETEPLPANSLDLMQAVAKNLA